MLRFSLFFCRRTFDTTAGASLASGRRGTDFPYQQVCHSRNHGKNVGRIKQAARHRRPAGMDFPAQYDVQREAVISRWQVQTRQGLSSGEAVTFDATCNKTANRRASLIPLAENRYTLELPNTWTNSWTELQQSKKQAEVSTCFI